MIDTQIPTIESKHLTTDARQLRIALRLQDSARGALIRDFLTPEEREELLSGTYTLRPYWRKGARTGESVLGRIWETAVEKREIMDYFEEADDFKGLIDESFPELITRVLEFCGKLVESDTVELRPDYAGPGLIIHTAGHEPQAGGQVLIQALSRRMLKDPLIEVYTVTVPLRLPETGAGIGTWADCYRFDRHDLYNRDITEPRGDMVTVPFELGAATIISGLRSHRLDSIPADGGDLVMLAFRLGLLDGRWQVWL